MPDRRFAPRARRCAIAFLIVALVALGVLAPGPTAAASGTPLVAGTTGGAELDPLQPAAGAYFGAAIDWGTDTAAIHAERLGRTPALLEHVTRFPASDQERTYLAQFLAQTVEVGALPVITIEPVGDLERFTPEDAAALADLLDEALEGRPAAAARVPASVRFAPQMNTPWVPWGMNPEAYVAAFRLVSETLSDRDTELAMVWSPASGLGYPFGAASQNPLLDTDGDGEVATGDDPYGPFYPGDRFVDGVGLVVYHDPSAGGAAVNALPDEADLLSQIDGEGDASFATRFSTDRRPLMLETAAFYSAGAGGAEEIDIKRAWWRQILAAIPEVSSLGAVIWRDLAVNPTGAGRSSIDWSLSGRPEIAAAFRSDADAGALVFGPVYDPVAVDVDALAQGGEIGGAAGWLVAAAVFAGGIVLLLWGLRQRPGARFWYDGSAVRDLRIDLLRGVAIVFVLVNHLQLTSLLQGATQEAVGMVSGAEFFVLLSGLVLAMVYRPKIAREGIVPAGRLILRRAGKIYLAALVIVITLGLLALIPGLNVTPATTFTDEGTGAAGTAATGRVYDLYAGFDRLFQYPVDASVFADILLLRMGPWQVNILGFYVVMLVVSPLILWALARRLWPLVLAVSWVVYSIQFFTRIRVLPSQFEDSFPLLTWQVLFVTGMVAGFHRHRVVEWFGTRLGRALIAVCAVTALLLALWSWNNPYLSSSLDLRLDLVPEASFGAVYSAAFERTYLDPGRILNVLVLLVTAYGLLTVLWRPIDRAVGWFFTPLGQTTLYVFIVQLILVLIVANIPVLSLGDVWINTAANIVILALVWIMVRKRVLFGVIPR